MNINVFIFVLMYNICLLNGMWSEVICVVLIFYINCLFSIYVLDREINKLFKLFMFLLVILFLLENNGKKIIYFWFD